MTDVIHLSFIVSLYWISLVFIQHGFIYLCFIKLNGPYLVFICRRPFTFMNPNNNSEYFTSVELLVVSVLLLHLISPGYAFSSINALKM